MMAAGLGMTVSKFAISLLQETVSNEENVFFSPASLAIALCMTMAGADGDTREQMLEVFKCGKDETATHGAFELLVNGMKTAAESCVLCCANRLYSMKNYDVNQRFLDTLSRRYHSDFKQVNFVDPAVRVEINEWVSGVTRQRINELIPKDSLDADTRLVIVNAIYFKSNWLEAFDECSTYDEDFYISATKKIKVKMMLDSSKDCRQYLYFEDETYQVIQLPYHEDNLCMVIFLPKKKDGLSHAVHQLNAETFLSYISVMQSKEVKVHLPRFRIEASYNLPAELTKLGMKDMFLPTHANFSRISKSPARLYVSGVIHKAFIEVNEEGTEAAAATAVIVTLQCGGMERRPRPVVFKADHPFFFSIFDHRFRCPLFCGAFVRPSNEGNMSSGENDIS